MYEKKRGNRKNIRRRARGKDEDRGKWRGATEKRGSEVRTEYV